MTEPEQPIRRSRPRMPGRRDEPQTPKGVQTIAALGLVIVAVAGVGALIFSAIVFGGDTAALVSLVSIALGGVIALAGAASKDAPKDRDPSGS